MRLGIIAGNGRFPFLVLDAARAQGHDVTVIALKEEAFADLDAAAASRQAAIHWISIGQVGKCIDLLKAAGATTAVMAGQVKHVKIFGGQFVPDFKAMGVLDEDVEVHETQWGTREFGFRDPDGNGLVFFRIL